jgi:molybdopterin/thiamine biosynthesis adenylyltransferase
MTKAEQFYYERDKRTILYIGGRPINQLPINVFLDPTTVATPVGQACALALANQLSRVHRNIRFIESADSVPLVVPALFPAPTFAETLLRTVTNIDPYGTFTISNSPYQNAISIGVGPNVSGKLDWYLGAAGAIATLDREPCFLDLSNPVTTLGAALASCLGAAAVFRSTLGLATARRQLSAWNYAEGADADLGPTVITPLDLGNTLLVGAGAVGSALIYWLHLFGVRGFWVIIDGDRVDLTNTNRQMIFIPADAGWFGGLARYKAEAVSAFLPNSQPYPCLYHECAAIKEKKFDLILALANEHSVRTRLAQRNPAVLLHATTGDNWLSECHRHIIGIDDCLQCRTEDIKTPRFGCSTTALPAQNEPAVPNAALPFLSAASGLMLATALQKLQLGQLSEGPINNWRWDFSSEHLMTSCGRRKCRDGCRIVPSIPLAQRLNKGLRWAHLIG